MVRTTEARFEAVGDGRGLAGWRTRLAEVLRRDPLASRDPHAEQRFERLLARLAAWSAAHGEVDEAYLLVHADGLVFLVLSRATPQDEAFEEALSALDVELACDGEVRFRVDVIALPRGARPEEVLRTPLVTIRIDTGRPARPGEER